MTTSARRWPRPRLYRSVPIESVLPSITTLRRGLSLIFWAASSSTRRPSGVSRDLSNSKCTDCSTMVSMTACGGGGGGGVGAGGGRGRRGRRRPREREPHTRGGHVEIDPGVARSHYPLTTPHVPSRGEHVHVL